MLKTHDMYLSGDLEDAPQTTTLNDLTVCELITHGGLQAEKYIEPLQREENRRTAAGRGRTRMISDKDAKNEAKNKQSMRLKNSMPDFKDLDVPHELRAPTRYSVALRFSWRQKTPFFSRAVDEFGTIDNPVTRDTLTNQPVLHASGAKGMLRGLLCGELSETELREFFGNDREIKNQDDAWAGIVVPGDVVFSGKTKTEVFSPHVRTTQTADHPVSFEVVPVNADAQWDILIFDFRNRQKAIFPCAVRIVRAVNDLVTEIGLSAKRTSGLGLGTDLKVEIKTGGAFPISPGKHSIEDAVKIMEGWK